MVRAPDAPIFGTDVVAAEGAHRRLLLQRQGGRGPDRRNPSADVQRLRPGGRAPSSPTAPRSPARPPSPIAPIGNLSRPYFPDGEVGKPNGPFSRPIAQFSPFSTGLQSALIIDQPGASISATSPALRPPTRRSAAPSCPTPRPARTGCRTASRSSPGGVPIYRGSTLVGGDRRVGRRHRPGRHDPLPRPVQCRRTRCGHRRGADRRSAPTRSWSRSRQAVRLRYVNCPFAPFLDTTDQNVCQGK